ncbi:MAG: Gfo/Idh/MocA family oxidoreductase [Chloroflexi bacterium]|nr:Gfo/Idh/MocA family oxidoreductase [Chloroflexota bacterium]
MQPVGIGLVGAGAFGVFCLDAFAEMPDVRITAVADVDANRARSLAAKHHAATYDSLDALLADESVEIVALNTPPYLHAAQGLAALAAGKHLFNEKPLALTLEDGAALIQEAGARNLRLTVDYVMRWNPYWAAAAHLARSGVLGALRQMDLANHAAGLDLPASHWFWDKAKSGGIWIEHGVHFFDAFTWVAGTPGQITASQSFTRADGATDRVEALARFGDAAAHFYHAFDKSGQTEQTTVILTFEQGYVTLREWVPTSMELLTTVEPETLRHYLPGQVAESERVGSQHRVCAFAPEGKSAIYRASIQAGMRDLARAVRNPAHTLAVTGQDGLDSLRLAVQAEALATP